VMGYLFYAAMGNVSTVANTDMDGNAATGVYTHIFNFNAQNTLPWFAVRRKIPGQTAAEDQGEYGIDCQLGAIRVNADNTGKVMMDAMIAGRRPWWQDGPLSWTWNNTLEDGTTIPESMFGSLSWGTDAPPMLDMRVDILNDVTLANPQSEFIIGSPYPDDSITISRRVMISGTLKYKNPALYKKLMTGSAVSTDWSSSPLVVKTVGGTYAFKSVFKAPLKIGATNTNYALAFRANAMTVISSPIQPAAGRMVTQEVSAVIQTPDAGDYFQIVLQNGVASYSWT
jgi:hypothetical protein